MIKSNALLTILFLTLLAMPVYATTKKPPKPPPPVGHTVEQQARLDAELKLKQYNVQETQQNTAVEIGDTTASGGDSNASSVSDAAAEAAGGSSDNAVAISNVYMSRAFAQDFPITHGCFVGINGGGDKTTQTKSTGGFLGFTYLSNSCHMQKLAAVEKDVDIVARLQCGDRKYRKAVAFDAPKGTSKREHCIAIKKKSLMGAIDLEKQALKDLAEQYKKKHDEVENLLVISQEHGEVCDESLSRCEDKVVGRK